MLAPRNRQRFPCSFRYLGCGPPKISATYRTPAPCLHWYISHLLCHFVHVALIHRSHKEAACGEPPQKLPETSLCEHAQTHIKQQDSNAGAFRGQRWEGERPQRFYLWNLDCATFLICSRIILFQISIAQLVT